MALRYVRARITATVMVAIDDSKRPDPTNTQWGSVRARIRRQLDAIANREREDSGLASIESVTLDSFIPKPRPNKETS